MRLPEKFAAFRAKAEFTAAIVFALFTAFIGLVLMMRSRALGLYLLGELIGGSMFLSSLFYIKLRFDDKRRTGGSPTT